MHALASCASNVNAGAYGLQQLRKAAVMQLSEAC